MLDGQLKVFKTIFLRSIEIIITSNIDCRWSDPCTYPLKFVFVHDGWAVKSLQDKSETVHFDLHVLLLNTGLLYASYYVINLVLFSYVLRTTWIQSRLSVLATCIQSIEEDVTYVFICRCNTTCTVITSLFYILLLCLNSWLICVCVVVA